MNEAFQSFKGQFDLPSLAIEGKNGFGGVCLGIQRGDDHRIAGCQLSAGMGCALTFHRLAFDPFQFGLGRVVVLGENHETNRQALAVHGNASPDLAGLS